MPESFPGSGAPYNPAGDAGREGASAEDAPRGGADPLIGKTISGRFKVVSVIARGGMGKVYKAEQAPLGRVCALKVLSPKYEGDKDPEFHKRFFLEAATAAKLTHPNTVTIFDYGIDDEIYYIAMEYIEGRTLFRALRDEGPFSEQRTAHIARQICRALREAHGLGVIHRDLKPGNVLLSSHGDERDYVKVLDFGLVKDVTGEKEDLTQQGLFMGSPKYMAPEQILGGECSGRTDVYALGIMMYEMLCGRVPFDRGAGVGTLMAHVHNAPPPMQSYYPGLVISPTMEAIVARCLEKDPGRRFASMNDLLGALRTGGDDSLVGDGNDSLSGPILSQGAYGPRSGARSNSSRPSHYPEATPYPPPHSRGPMSSSPSSIMRREQPSGPNSRPSASYPGVPVSSMPADPRMFASPSITDLSPAPAPIPDTGVVEPPATKKRIVPWVIAGVAALVAVVVFITSRSGAGPTGATADAAPSAAPSAATAAPTVAPAPTQAPTVTAAAAPVERKVRIESSPAGAAVLENGKAICDSTPCTATWKGDDAKVDRKLTISKKGYKPATLSVGADDEKVSAPLVPLPAKATPDGYKDAY
jgi:serine/threonine-protein kinase